MFLNISVPSSFRGKMMIIESLMGIRVWSQWDNLCTKQTLRKCAVLRGVSLVHSVNNLDSSWGWGGEVPRVTDRVCLLHSHSDIESNEGPPADSGRPFAPQRWFLVLWCRKMHLERVVPGMLSIAPCRLYHRCKDNPTPYSTETLPPSILLSPRCCQDCPPPPNEW